MNPCVKTGLWFIDAHDRRARTGDLFCIGGMWSIRGVPRLEGFEFNEAQRSVVQATLRVRQYHQRPGSHYHDAECDLVAVDDRFRKDIAEWYPELVGILPARTLEEA